MNKPKPLDSVYLLLPSSGGGCMERRQATGTLHADGPHASQVTAKLERTSRPTLARYAVQADPKR
jgi:hypothetical protein